MMLIKGSLNITARPNFRLFCTRSNPSPKSLLIQQTTYRTDDWTNIQPRFKPFVGVNLYQKKKYPLSLVQESIGKYFQNWFRKNVNPIIELPIYRGTDPIEPNTRNDPDPNAFYINREFVLRTSVINREMKLLKKGLNEFLFVADLYRKCQMDSKHFPVFHRVNVVRLTECETLTKELTQHLENEQKIALIQMFNHLFETDLKFRWVNSDWKFTDPSWALEIYHYDEWHRLGGTGMIRKEILEQSGRNGVTGWEIGIGLDHLAMTLLNIFDIRMIWNSNNTYSPNLVPTLKISENTQTKIKTRGGTVENPSSGTVKPQNYDYRISYILPENVELESFPMDKLCEFLKKHVGDAAEKVAIIETFYHPEYKTNIINVQIIYKKQKNRTKSDIQAIHHSVRARAAHSFNLTLRL